MHGINAESALQACHAAKYCCEVETGKLGPLCSMCLLSAQDTWCGLEAEELPPRTGLSCALQAYLRKASPQIAANKQLEPLLGVFQKLNASKALDHEAFNLLEGLTQHLWDKRLQQYMGRVSGADPPPCTVRDVQ